MGSSNQELTRVLQVPNVVLPPDIDSLDASTLHDSLEATKFQRGDRTRSSLKIPKRSPSKVTLPPDIECLDVSTLQDSLDATKFHRGGRTHSSLKIPKRPPSKRRLCRHHSDSETRGRPDDLPSGRPMSRRSSRKVRRSVSAIETNKTRYRPRVRRSISDRSGLLFAGRHLVPPRSLPSRCSSTKTLSSHHSLSEIVAVELGLKEIPGLTPKEARRKRVVCTVMLVSLILLVLSVLLVAVTLFLSPAVDEVLRKGNEEIYRSMSAGASTSSPTTEDAVVANNTTPSGSSPG